MVKYCDSQRVALRLLCHSEPSRSHIGGRLRSSQPRRRHLGALLRVFSISKLSRDPGTLVAPSGRTSVKEGGHPNRNACLEP